LAKVFVPQDELSLAIGKDGQNVRLASKLTGYRIEIEGNAEAPKEVEAQEPEEQVAAEAETPEIEAEQPAASEEASQAEEPAETPNEGVLGEETNEQA
jgi:N utilization substance protein A